MTKAVTKLILTGASGFVGSALLNLLGNDSRFHTTAIARKNVSVRTERVTIKAVKDINGSTDWRDVIDGVDCVLHVAGRAHVLKDPSVDVLDSFRKINVEGTLGLARQAADLGMRRFVFVSSIGVYGNTSSEPFAENTKPCPHAEYANSKLEAEVELQKLSEQLKFELVIVRPVLVYGAGAPGNFGQLAKLVDKVPVLPFGVCSNRRSFISVGNLGDFLLLCATHPEAANQDFVISDDNDVSILEFTDALARGLDKKIIQLPIPVLIMRLFAKLSGKAKQADQLLGDLQVDCSKAKRLLGWRPPETMAQAMAKLKKSDTDNNSHV